MKTVDSLAGLSVVALANQGSGEQDVSLFGQRPIGKLTRMPAQDGESGIVTTFDQRGARQFQQAAFGPELALPVSDGDEDLDLAGGLTKRDPQFLFGRRVESVMAEPGCHAGSQLLCIQVRANTPAV